MLNVEKNLLLSLYTDVACKECWGKTLKVKYQLNYIESQLLILNVSFADMYAIGESHGFEEGVGIMRMNHNFYLFIYDILLATAEDLGCSGEMIENLNFCHLYTHDSIYRLAYLDHELDLSRLDEVFNFYKIAKEIDGDRAIYELNGQQYEDPCPSAINDLFLSVLKEKTQELIAYHKE